MKDLFASNKKLYLITDRNISGLSHLSMVRKAARSGIKVVQIREKLLSKKKLYSELMILRRLASRQNITLIVNDYVDIALAVSADGVHLGQDDMPVREARGILGRKVIIGKSTHTVKQAVDAELEGADYIGFGPVFFTDTKDAGSPRGVSRLRNVRRAVRIPLVAIGGITSENVRQVLDAGADA
ncbi:MAG: thiamine phosphate synthase, partial [Deltaproteobacteria bacterium]|nr:thiamine phosphate synthase [Deltaproteobacteria bacterium]